MLPMRPFSSPWLCRHATVHVLPHAHTHTRVFPRLSSRFVCLGWHPTVEDPSHVCPVPSLPIAISAASIDISGPFIAI